MLKAFPLYEVLNTINLMIRSDPLFESVVKKVVVDSLDPSSIYWNLSYSKLAEIEEIISKIMVGGDEKPCSALSVLQTFHSTLHVQLAFADVDLEALVKTYVMAMEKSVRPMNVSEDTLKGSDEITGRIRILVNQGWLFTLCLIELSLQTKYNVAFVLDNIDVIKGKP